jgi:hypothetical protein
MSDPPTDVTRDKAAFGRLLRRMSALPAAERRCLGPALAGYILRHLLLQSSVRWQMFREQFWEEHRSRPADGYSAAMATTLGQLEIVREACTQCGVHGTLFDGDLEVASHLLQRWTRQLGSADSPIGVQFRPDGSLSVASRKRCVVRPGGVLHQAVLDGLAWVPPAGTVDHWEDFISHCSIDVPRRRVPAEALLLGPLQLVTDGDSGLYLAVESAQAGSVRRDQRRRQRDDALFTDAVLQSGTCAAVWLMVPGAGPAVEVRKLVPIMVGDLRVADAEQGDDGRVPNQADRGDVAAAPAAKRHHV